MATATTTSPVFTAGLSIRSYYHLFIHSFHSSVIPLLLLALALASSSPSPSPSSSVVFCLFLIFFVPLNNGKKVPDPSIRPRLENVTKIVVKQEICRLHQQLKDATALVRQ